MHTIGRTLGIREENVKRNFMILLRGKQLNPESTFGQLNIQTQDELVLQPKLQGGNGDEESDEELTSYNSETEDDEEEEDDDELTSDDSETGDDEEEKPIGNELSDDELREMIDRINAEYEKDLKKHQCSDDKPHDLSPPDRCTNNRLRGHSSINTTNNTGRTRINSTNTHGTSNWDLNVNSIKAKY
jgi:hypothetical protein